MLTDRTTESRTPRFAVGERVRRGGVELVVAEVMAFGPVVLYACASANRPNGGTRLVPERFLAPADGTAGEPVHG